MNNFNQEEIKNIITLIGRANITGQEATPTAILLQKLSSLLTPEDKKEEKKK